MLMNSARKRSVLFSLFLTLSLGFLSPEPGNPQGADPFSVSAELGPVVRGEADLTISYKIPPNHHMYGDMMSVKVPDGLALEGKNVPSPEKRYDPLSEEERELYAHDFQAVYRLKGVSGPTVHVEVKYQGCSETVCFFPATVPFDLEAKAAADSGKGPVPEGAEVEPRGEESARTPAPAEAAATPAPSTADEADDWRALVERFTIGGAAAGYIKASDFLAFLESAKSGEGSKRMGLAGMAEEAGVFLQVLLILLGGLLLNLTPCVLPMIPINLAIIGAGTRASSRSRGFALGGAYGAGIAGAYGLLGVFAVLTGSTFGDLNASPVFNFSIAALFVALALAMFGVFSIDFTRFRRAVGERSASRAGFAAVFFMGAVAALLAGACVAPVLISVLLIASQQVAAGNQAGLLLPFLLGVGMALPWPLAGAGLSFLPKPGGWMNWVKCGFGVFILLMALYYGHLGYTLTRGQSSERDAAELGAIRRASVEEGAWLTSLPAALKQAQREKKPVFIDFWATWCKNCLTMDKTTFRDPEVRRALESFVKVRYQAEKPRESPAREVLEYFDAKGLPTYVVLLP